MEPGFIMPPFLGIGEIDPVCFIDSEIWTAFATTSA
jgi:hypothetical protein